MPLYKPELRVPPPECDEDHPQIRGVRRNRYDCPKCIRWDHHIQAVRRDQVRDGLRINQPRVLSQPVPASRCKPHTRYTAGCEACRAWARYQSTVRRHLMLAGELEYSVKVSIVQAHLQTLIDKETGGWFLQEIADATGISVTTVSDIANGDRTGKVYAITWNSLKVLKPKGKAIPRISGHVPALEVRRIYQGLSAQGWTFDHMASLMGRATKTAANRYATDTTPWVTREALDLARVLRDKLGPYDIAELDVPMPGMARRCSAAALRKGWAPLRDWDGLDIADPDAVPFRADHWDEVAAGGLLVDYETVRRAIERVEQDRVAALGKVNREPFFAPSQNPHRGELPRYVPTVGKINRFEAFAVAWFAQQADVSATDTGLILGYPQQPARQRENGQRQAARMRAHLRDARLWLEAEPDGTNPPWLRRPPRLVDVVFYLTPLLALQPAPFGYGWSVDQLAERCGIDVTTADIERVLADARLVAARRWKAERWVKKRRKRTPRAATRTPE